jgi:hypothetical protein
MNAIHPKIIQQNMNCEVFENKDHVLVNGSYVCGILSSQSGCVGIPSANFALVVLN